MIEDYINDMNMAEIISGSIKVLIDENKELQERINKAIEIVEKYNLGKYDYSIPPVGIIELLEILKGNDEE